MPLTGGWVQFPGYTFVQYDAGPYAGPWPPTAPPVASFPSDLYEIDYYVRPVPDAGQSVVEGDFTSFTYANTFTNRNGVSNVLVDPADATAPAPGSHLFVVWYGALPDGSLATDTPVVQPSVAAATYVPDGWTGAAAIPPVSISIVTHAADGTVEALLPDWNGGYANVEHNEAGNAQVDYPDVGLNADKLYHGAEFSVRLTGVEPDNCRFIVNESVESKAASETNQGVTQWTAEHILAMLRFVLVYPMNWPNVQPPYHSFTNASPGTIIKTLMQRGIERGALWAQNIGTSTFTTTTDSNGNTWATTWSQNFDAGSNSVLDVLTTLRDQGAIDFATRGRELLIFNKDTYGTDTTTTPATAVVIRRGEDQKDSPNNKTSRDIATAMLVGGDEGSYAESTSAAEASRGRWEQFITQGGAKTTPTLQLVGSTALATRDKTRESRSAAVAILTTKAQPLVHYKPGDYVYQNRSGTNERVRVMQVNYTLGTVPTASLTLNDKLQDLDVIMKRRLDMIGGGVLSSGQVTSGTQADTIPPNAPTNLTATSSTYVSADGSELVQLVVSWSAPQNSQDGSNLTDLAYYDLQYTFAGVGWQSAPPPAADAQTTNVAGLPTGASITYRIRAVDASRNASGWTTNTINTSGASITPPTPSTPAFAWYSSLAIGTQWDGKDATGAAYPANLDRVEIVVTAGATDAVTKVPDAIIQSAGTVYFLSPYWNGGGYVRFRAVNKNGLSSSWSTARQVASRAQTQGRDLYFDPALSYKFTIIPRQYDLASSASMDGMILESQASDSYAMMMKHMRYNVSGWTEAAAPSLRGARVTGVPYIDAVLGDQTAYIAMRASAFTVSSDEAAKVGVADLADHDALRDVTSTPAKTYQLRGEHDGGRTRRGLIAQQAPEHIRTSTEDFEGIDLYGMAATNWGATRALTALVRKLMADLEELRGGVNTDRSRK